MQIMPENYKFKWDQAMTRTELINASTGCIRANADVYTCEFELVEVTE